MFMGGSNTDRERVMLQSRKGFIRVAVEEGLDGGLVPVYHYGNSLVGFNGINPFLKVTIYLHIPQPPWPLTFQPHHPCCSSLPLMHAIH